MIRRPALCLLVALAFFAGSSHWMRAETTGELVRDDSGQISVISQDVIISANVAELASDARKKLVSVLGLPVPWKNRITIRVQPQQPNKPWESPVITASVHGGLLNFTISFHGPAPEAPEEFLRALTQVCLYEKIISNNASFKKGTSLPQIPLWLHEGTLQLLLVLQNRDWEQLINHSGKIPTWRAAGNSKFGATLEAHEWELVVSRAQKINMAPTLDTVLGWQELSPDPIERMSQQAFCYYLVNSLTRTNSARDSFQQWLMTGDSMKPPFGSIASLLADEFAWRAQLGRANERSRNLVYSWRETEAELKKAMFITLLPSGNAKEVETTIDVLEPYRNHPGFADAVREKINELTDIELRANFLWKPVPEYYRSALLELANIKPPTDKKDPQLDRGSKSFGLKTVPVKRNYADFVRAAKDYEAQVVKKYDDVNDYLNWVIVTHSTESSVSELDSYFQMQKSLNAFQPRQKDKLTRQILILQTTEE